VCREALERARRLDLRLAVHELARTLAFIRIEQGGWTEAKHDEEEALRLAIEEGWPGAVGEGLTALMILDALMGHGARALRRARPALRLLRQYQRYLLPTALRAVALAYRTSGRPRRATLALHAAMAALPAGATLLDRQWTGIEHGNLLIRTGRWEEARRLWQDA